MNAFRRAGGSVLVNLLVAEQMIMHLSGSVAPRDIKANRRVD